MKNIIALLCGIIMLFTVSCGTIAFKEEAFDVAIEVAAFTLGYEGCKGDTVTFKELAITAKNGLVLLEADELTLNELVTDLKEKGADAITSDPLTKYQITKLLSLLDVNLEADIIDIDDSKYDYVKLAINAFIEGVNACE